MSDTGIVISSLGFLVVNSVLLSMAGIGDVTFELPSNPYKSSGGGQTETSGTVDTVFCTAGVIAGGVVGGAGGALLGFGVGGIAGAALGGALAGSLLGCTKVQDTVSFVLGLVELVLNFFGFLFQLMFYQIDEIPVFLNSIIVLPPGIGLGFVGLKAIRGTA